MSTSSAYVVILLYTWNVYSFTRGIPTLDSLSSGNTVVTESGLSVKGTTTQCYSPVPSFTWELVATDGRFSSVSLTGDTATATVGGSCSGGSSLYIGSVSVSYSVNPVVYGQTVYLRLTINNTPSISTTSTGTLSVPVSYNLTGSSEMASLGQQFTWTCQMTLPPSQTQVYIRFYRNETSAATVGYNTQCQGFGVNSRYNYSCTTPREFNLIIPAQSVTQQEQYTVWRCAYYSGFLSYSSVQKQLVIAIDVSSVSLDPSDDPLTMTAGEQRTVRCVVNDDASPVPVYQWLIGTTVVGDRSSLTITGRKSDNGMLLRCQATNNNKPRNASITLNIQYKPEVTTSTSSPYRVVEGQSATMTCSVNAANPNTDITWSWIKTDSPRSVLHTGSTYTISNIQRGASGTYSCTATNSIGISTLVTVQIDVQYKPEVTTNTSSPYRVVEGQSATMTCSVSAANPNTGITWSWIKTDSPSNVLHTRSTYTISNMEREASGTYSCTARNSIGISTPVKVQVDVQYKPDVTITASPYRVVEGQSATMTCSVSAANPNTGITWSWIKTDSPSNVLHTGSTYTISNIERGASGTYRCTATNSIGASTPVTVEVDIQYSNVITSNLSERYVSSEHGRLQIKCDVDGNPLSTITWLFIQNNTVIKRDSNVNSSTLDISSANCLDYGSYKVTAENGKWPAAVRTIHVAVKCKPRLYNIDFQSPVRLVMRNSDSLHILVRTLLYPPATLTQWIFIGNNNTNKVIQNNTDGYRLTDTKGEVEQNITLYKSRISTEDFGDYIIMVQNDIGTFHRIYHVDTARIQESVENQTGVAVGSAVGIVTFIIITLVLVILLRRRYTFTCIIKIERKNIDKHLKMRDATKEECSMSMGDQTVQIERGLYEEVTERENVNQYEGLNRKEQSESEERKTYESIQGSSVENKYEKLSTVIDKQDDDGKDPTSTHNRPMSTPADVYINTSFQK
ncbi:hemicentin-2-like isoform X1 [Ostrea edulis]|uniref:hemicentin-2-like isoform X1 n=1 Tax=Ostrea edulis TaxID=37623 RepID=UPI0024AEA2EA|nr:hemicentin-2-like isoform X1 [Ostrea edulis]